MADLLRLLFELFSHWETVARAFAAFLVALGIVCFVAHNKGGFRSLRIPGVLLGCLGAILLFGVRNADSLENRAKGVLELPKEAHVLRVEEGDWSSDDSVTFELPTNHSVKFWLDSVWKMNGFGHSSSPSQKATCQPDDQSIIYSDSEGARSLSYDAVTQSYSYHSEW